MSLAVATLSNYRAEARFYKLSSFNQIRHKQKLINFISIKNIFWQKRIVVVVVIIIFKPLVNIIPRSLKTEYK